MIMHADLDDFILKIADFGLSTFMDDKPYVDTLAGTFIYRAPEVKPINGVVKYDKKADMWSLGLIMLECFLSTREFYVR
jgi:serine/threonine protein kinase